MQQVMETVITIIAVLAAIGPILRWALKQAREKTEWGKANQGVVDLLVNVIETVENGAEKPDKPVKQAVAEASKGIDPKVAQALHDALDKLAEMRKSKQAP